MGYIKSHIFNEFAADKTVAFQHMEMIGRCFYSNTTEEIMQNLRDEGTPFALKCLAAMERNSDLSMKLALKMLRQATSLDYVKCLKMEVKVASSMIETKEFDIGV
jgi:enoyl-CoA hydratase/carnithine racemase